MKTVAERNEDEAKAAENHRAVERRRLETAIRYVDKVDALNIEPYAAPADSPHRRHDAERSQAVRSAIRQIVRRAADPVPEGVMIVSAPGYFINTACDHCGTALFDDQPSHTYGDTFKVGCVGCGWAGHVKAAYRSRAVSHELGLS